MGSAGAVAQAREGIGANVQKRKPGQPHRKWKDAARHRFTREEAFRMAIRASRANSKRKVPMPTIGETK